MKMQVFREISSSKYHFFDFFFAIFPLSRRKKRTFILVCVSHLLISPKSWLNQTTKYPCLFTNSSKYIDFYVNFCIMGIARFLHLCWQVRLAQRLSDSKNIAPVCTLASAVTDMEKQLNITDVHTRQFSQNRDAMHLRNRSDRRYLPFGKKLFAGAVISRVWVRAEL